MELRPVKPISVRLKRKASSEKKESNNKRKKTNKGEAMKKVFGNDLIFRYVEKLISFQDLKNLRLVNRQFNANVIDHTRFISRITFTVNKELIAARILEKTQLPIRYMKVNCFRADWKRTYMCNRLCATRYDPSNEEVRVTSPPKKAWMPEEVEHVYAACQYLEELEIECDDSEFGNHCLCDIVDESAFPIYPSVKRILQSAKAVKKLKLNSMYLKHLFGCSTTDLKSCLQKLTHLEVLKDCDRMPLTLLSLRKLKLLKTVSYDVNNFDDSKILQLICQNAKTLESLSYSVPNHWNANRLARLARARFSNLKHVQIGFQQVDVPYVLKFLHGSKHKIETLHLKCGSGEEDDDDYDTDSSDDDDDTVVFSHDVIDVLPDMPRLTDLGIKTVNVSVKKESLALLAKCPRLRSVQLHFSSLESLPSKAEMFSYLPSSVRSVSLLGRDSSRGTPLPISKIVALKNLTRLELFRCKRLVNNETLQGIFQHMSSLKELVLTNAKRCDMAGFAGRGGYPVSIRNLQDLRQLVLQDCNLDTDGIESFSFPKLVEMDLTGNSLNFSSWREILSRNPMLETLRVNKAPMDLTRDAVLELKEDFPAFNYLHIKNIHGKYISICLSSLQNMSEPMPFGQ